jgi:hypothetical protein
MKMNLAAKFSLLAVLFLVAAFLTGCQTEPVIDESIRNSALDQTAAEPSFSDSKTANKQTGSRTAQVIGQTEPVIDDSLRNSAPDQAATGPSFNDGKTVDKPTGSRTAQVIDWNSRIGNYTYDQAVTELGIPNQKARLSDDKVVSKWFVQSPVGPRFNSGMSYYGNTGFGANQRVGSSYNNRVLQLTFGTNGVLAAWSKNY